MPPARDSLGERISSLEATVSSLKEYEHDRWHKLDNDLTPLVNLPERLRNFTEAIEKALEPMSDNIAQLNARVSALEVEQRQFTGARRLVVWFVQTIIAATAAVIAALTWGKHP